MKIKIKKLSLGILIALIGALSINKSYAEVIINPRFFGADENLLNLPENADIKKGIYEAIDEFKDFFQNEGKIAMSFHDGSLGLAAGFYIRMPDNENVTPEKLIRETYEIGKIMEQFYEPKYGHIFINVNALGLKREQFSIMGSIFEFLGWDVEVKTVILHELMHAFGFGCVYRTDEFCKHIVDEDGHGILSSRYENKEAVEAQDQWYFQTNNGRRVKLSDLGHIEAEYGADGKNPLMSANAFRVRNRLSEDEIAIMETLGFNMTRP